LRCFCLVCALQIAKCLRPGAIIYIQTLSWEGRPLHWFAERLAPLLTQGFILITGEADEDPVREAGPLFASPNLLHWFAQHVPSPHHKLEPIPLGINCFEHGPELHKWLSGRAASATTTNSIGAPVQVPALFPPHRIPPKLVVVNFDVGTHGSRMAIWRLFCGDQPHNAQTLWERERNPSPPSNQSNPSHHYFADCPPKQIRNLMRRNNHLQTHYSRLSEYKFWICPRGNGLDTHRAWEALYVGAVPIIKRSGLDPLFEDGMWSSPLCLPPHSSLCFARLCALLHWMQSIYRCY
jgi:hypothetical protein